MSDPIKQIVKSDDNELILEELLYTIMKLNQTVRYLVAAVKPDANFLNRQLAYGWATKEINRAQPSLDHVEAMLYNNGLIGKDFDEEDRDEENETLLGDRADMEIDGPQPRANKELLQQFMNSDDEE